MTHDAHGAINDVFQNVFETPATYGNLVYAEFSRRQTLDIQVAFKFTVELFAGIVIMIQPDHLLCLAGQVGPIGIYFNLGNRQVVAVAVGDPFDHFEDH